MYGASIREINFGPDKIHVIGDTVMVFASREMLDWTVREFCVVPIIFEEEKYYLKRKLPATAPHAIRYELAPWTDELGTESSRSICYDEDYVEQRELDHKAGRRQEHTFYALHTLYPLLGFCWSGFKARVLGPMGFEAREITTASVGICFAYWMLESIFVLYFHAGFLGVVCGSWWLLRLDWLLFLLLPLDCAVRYGHVIRGDDSPDGFLEWIFHRGEPR